MLIELTQRKNLKPNQELLPRGRLLRYRFIRSVPRVLTATSTFRRHFSRKHFKSVIGGSVILQTVLTKNFLRAVTATMSRRWSLLWWGITTVPDRVRKCSRHQESVAWRLNCILCSGQNFLNHALRLREILNQSQLAPLLLFFPLSFYLNNPLHSISGFVGFCFWVVGLWVSHKTKNPKTKPHQSRNWIELI